MESLFERALSYAGAFAAAAKHHAQGAGLFDTWLSTTATIVTILSGLGAIGALIYRSIRNRAIERAAEIVIDRVYNHGNFWSGQAWPYYFYLLDLAKFPSLEASWSDDDLFWSNARTLLTSEGQVLHPGRQLFYHVAPGNWLIVIRAPDEAGVRRFIHAMRQTFEGGVEYIYEFEEFIPALDERKTTFKLRSRNHVPK